MSIKSHSQLPRFRMSLTGEEAIQLYNLLAANQETLQYEGKQAFIKMSAWINKLDAGMLSPAYIPTRTVTKLSGQSAYSANLAPLQPMQSGVKDNPTAEDFAALQAQILAEVSQPDSQSDSQQSGNLEDIL